MKLIQLPTGDWIAPSSVRGIRKLPAGFCPITKTIFEPRFVVDTAAGPCIMIECADADDVNAKADALALQVNEALDNPQPGGRES